MNGRSAFFVGLGVVYSTLLFSCPAHSTASDCKPAITVEPVSAGLAQIVIAAPCFPRGKVRFHYDTLDLVRVLDDAGNLSMTFDCFLGDKPPLVISFPDELSIPVQLQTVDLDRITKIAVIWKGSVNLDLHAFEYAASLSDEGHVWAGEASSRWQAEERKKRDKRGHGFISFSSNGSTEGDQLEVYTFVHEPSQKNGAVTLALDYETRARLPRDPDTCGTGLYAELEYRVAVWRPNGHVSRSRGSFSPQECNQITDQIARYNSKALPQLILTR